MAKRERINRIAKARRKAILLARNEGLTYAECGKMFGVSKQHASALIGRAEREWEEAVAASEKWLAEYERTGVIDEDREGESPPTP